MALYKVLNVVNSFFHRNKENSCYDLMEHTDLYGNCLYYEEGLCVCVCYTPFLYNKGHLKEERNIYNVKGLVDLIRLLS